MTTYCYMTKTYNSLSFGPSDLTGPMYYPVPQQPNVVARVYPDTVSIAGIPFSINTSFEPYRREAFRHRTIAPQRESVNFENAAGYGTLNTQGLWRRDQLDWSHGAGQQFLDRKSDSDSSRFYTSKGVNPWVESQLTLLNDTAQRVPIDAYAGTASATSGTILAQVSANWTTNQWVGAVVSGNTGWQSTGFPTSATVVSNTATVLTVAGWSDLNTPYATGAFTITPVGQAVKAVAVGNKVFVFDDGANTIKWYATSWHAGATSGTVAVSSLGTLNDICTDGAYVYVATSNGLWQIDGTASTPAATQIVTTGAVTAANNALPGCTFSTASNTVICTTGFPNVTTGQPVSGTGIPTGCYVNAVSSTGTSISIAPKTTAAATGSGTTLTFTVQYGYTITSFQSVWICNNVLMASASQVTGNSGPANMLCAFVTQPASPATAVVANSVLMIHPNPNFNWTSAVGGATQIYCAGNVMNASVPTRGVVYRSSMTGTTSNTSVNQPYDLNYPVQSLPLEVGEYVTCLYSYLNYIFIGTNLGVRMCQTLSVYDPSATQTGDLKSGPLEPNLLQPVGSPVCALVGDGRFLYFGWSNYDATSTGIGRMDLTQSIGGDSLTLAYASDLMVGGPTSNVASGATVQGKINWLDWDPISNSPLISVVGAGVYSASSAAAGDSYTYVKSGYINSGAITYGIPDDKIPVQYQSSVELPSTTTTSVSLDLFNTTGSDNILNLGYYTGGQITLPGVYRSERCNVVVTLGSDSTSSYTPTLYRFTLKSWPAVVTETNITPVLQFYRANVSGMQVEYNDPYASFWFLQELLQNQSIVEYVEGPLTANVVVEGMDWLPHKLNDNYEQGFIGDCVVTLKTIGGYSYIPTARQ